MPAGEAGLNPRPGPQGGDQPLAGEGVGGGLTHAGPASSGGVGVLGRQAPAGVGALQVEALGGRRAVVLQAVGTLVPVCGREGDGPEPGGKARGWSGNGREQSKVPPDGLSGNRPTARPG